MGHGFRMFVAVLALASPGVSQALVIAGAELRSATVHFSSLTASSCNVSLHGGAYFTAGTATAIASHLGPATCSNTLEGFVFSAGDIFSNSTALMRQGSGQAHTWLIVDLGQVTVADNPVDISLRGSFLSLLFADGNVDEVRGRSYQFAYYDLRTVFFLSGPIFKSYHPDIGVNDRLFVCNRRRAGEPYCTLPGSETNSYYLDRTDSIAVAPGEYHSYLHLEILAGAQDRAVPEPGTLALLGLGLAGLGLSRRRKTD